MQALVLLSQLLPSFAHEKSKVHLASFNGVDAPIDVYLAGEFPEWQRHQSGRNFQREYVVSLVELAEPHLWLFAGLYVVDGVRSKQEKGYFYDLTEVPKCNELNGRLVVKFARPGRNSYLRGEKWTGDMAVHEIRRNRLTIRDFPGYRNVDISFAELRHLAIEAPASWTAALSSVAGVYLITDLKLGKLYVGSASGQGGFWSRWQMYAKKGHGGNSELRKLLTLDPEHHKHWRLSILELADVTASDESVLARESHWKNILISRTHGLNAN